jgi:hypothetical protein
MQELSHEGKMFQVFLHIKKIQLSEVSEKTNMTRGDIYELFSCEIIPDESKKQIEQSLGRTFDFIMNDEACKTEMIRQVNSPNYQEITKLCDANHAKEKSIETIINTIKSFAGK